jgi:hypothetical protein
VTETDKEMAERLVREAAAQCEKCYLYNESFKCYDERGELSRHEAEALCARFNQCKGGHYVVRSKNEWKAHYEEWVAWRKVLL